MPDQADPRIEEVLARHTFELERVKDALGLLGVSPCFRCKRFFRRSDAGALFDAGGELVCYVCVHDWWTQRCTQLSTTERENLESKLVYWLRGTHHAEIFKDPAKLPEPSQQELNLVANCLNAAEPESHWGRTAAATARGAGRCGLSSRARRHKPEFNSRAQRGTGILQFGWPFLAFWAPFH